jgi:hypothetical protein
LATYHSITTCCRAAFRVFEDILIMAVVAAGLGTAGGGHRFGVIASCGIIMELCGPTGRVLGRVVRVQV